MAVTQQQQQSGVMVYPGKGVRRFFFRMPVYLWRLGLGGLLPRNFVLLTVYGRKSGEPRRTMLECWRHDGHYYVSSGWGAQAQWYRNIEANPAVMLQPAGGQPTPALASTDITTDDFMILYDSMQHSPFWKPYLRSLGIEPTREAFLAHTDRVHLVRFTPAPEADSPPPQPADWRWVWLVVGVLVGVLALARRR